MEIPRSSSRPADRRTNIPVCPLVDNSILGNGQTGMFVLLVIAIEAFHGTRSKKGDTFYNIILSGQESNRER